MTAYTKAKRAEAAKAKRARAKIVREADKAREARVIAKGGETSEMQKARYRSPQRDYQSIPKNVIVGG